MVACLSGRFSCRSSPHAVQRKIVGSESWNFSNATRLGWTHWSGSIHGRGGGSLGRVLLIPARTYQLSHRSQFPQLRQRPRVSSCPQFVQVSSKLMWIAWVSQVIDERRRRAVSQPESQAKQSLERESYGCEYVGRHASTNGSPRSAR